MSRESRPRHLIVGVLIPLVVLLAATVDHPRAQGQTAPSGVVAGRNVNMVSGREWPNGDPYLQRQNEPSVAASTRNPLHLLGGANDYRTVDIPGLPEGLETGDAWVGLFKSFDGGQRWISNLVAGYPQDTTPIGLASPLRGYAAAADPVVRAGTHGLFYYSGLVFDRGDTGKSGIFVARYVDNNNKENGDPIAYLGASIAASDPGTTGRFLDKPWMAVDMPRHGAATCTITTPGEDGPIVQHIPAGTVYVAYTAITGEGASLRAEILFTRSLDCGQTWSAPLRLSRAEDPINQGATIAIDPRTGSVYVAWRRFSLPGTADDQDAIMVARSVTFGRKWLPPGVARRFPRGQKTGLMLAKFFEHRKPKKPVEVAELAEFDQGSSADAISFRTNAYPAMAIDDRGRLYVAWSERGFATTLPSPVDGDARILVATSPNGSSWTPPRVAEEMGQAGHQIMPSLGVANGRVLLAYYDLREDRSQVFAKYVDDKTAIQYPVEPGKPRRHTIDLRASMAPVGSDPVFGPSVRVSEYRWGFRSATGPFEQLQVNAPNLPMFKRGTVPFFGDYIDLAPAPTFVPLPGGQWTFALNDTAPPVFHAVWTDNRDVRPPSDGDWTRYTPPNSPARPANSRIDGSPIPLCEQAFAATRNQNIYTARLTGGLLVGSPGNTKPLAPLLPRAFVVFAHNTTSQVRSFRLTILSQPPGGRASFEQFPLPPYDAASPPPVTAVDVTTAPRSLAARSVYVTSSDPDARVTVNVEEIAAAGGAVVAGGLTGRILLNPDVENPDVENPDVENPDVENPDVENAEVYTPDVENPDVENPDVENPDVENPDVENPHVENVNVANPDVENPDVENPDVENPDVENPDVENPDVENPDVENGTISDVSWTITNNGNTTAAYNVNLFLTSGVVPEGIAVQLILHKLYKTPISYNCDLKFETQNVLVANIPDPRFLGPNDPALPDPNSPDVENATLWLGPGESAKITLRVIDPDKSNNVIVNGASIDPAFVPGEQVTPLVRQAAINTDDLDDTTEPPVVTPTGSTILFVRQPANGAVNAPLFPVSVQVRDSSGAVVPDITVTMSLGTNPGGATLSGALAAITDASGLATFSSLTLDRVGIGYTLVASAAVPGFSLTPATSLPFGVFEACAATGSASVRSYAGGSGSRYAFFLQIADMNADGHKDAAFLGQWPAQPPVFTILYQNPAGDFKSGSGFSSFGGADTKAFAIGDFHENGTRDVVFANGTAQTVTVVPLTPGAFVGSLPPISTGVGGEATRLAVGHFNADSHLDVAVVRHDLSDIAILFGDGTGHFSAGPTIGDGSFDDLASRDVSGDGFEDLVAVAGREGSSEVVVFLGDGSGGFTELPAVSSGDMSVALVVEDLDGDGHPDAATADELGHTLTVLVGDGTGTLAAGPAVPLPFAPSSVVAGDFDGDGRADLAATSPAVSAFAIAFGQAAPGVGFGNLRTFAAGGPAPMIVADDFNGDELTDLVMPTANAASSFSVLLNSCGVTTADLAVTMVSPPGPVPVGTDVTFTATVTNNGPFDASAVTLTGEAYLFFTRDPVALQSAVPTQGSCTPGPALDCALGSLAVGASAQVLATYRIPPGAGGMFFDATAVSSELDLTSTNNLASGSVTAVPAPMTLVVTNTNDSGPGSLREALTLANQNSPAHDTITFDIPGPVPYSIALTSDALPPITDPVTIDGTTQPGFPGTPIIELSGAALPPGAPGLRISAVSPGSVVRGLVINRVATGIVITGGGVTVAGNYIGTNVAGTAHLGGIGTCISVTSPNNLIGGVSPADRNVLSGSLTLSNATVDIQGALATNNQVIGNFIGTTADGQTAFADESSGVTIQVSASGNLVQGNLITGQGNSGVALLSGANNIVRGNLIGTDVDGTTALPNRIGVLVTTATGSVIGGDVEADRNVISGNSAYGVMLQGATSATVKGNYIGTSASGDAAIPNATYGVFVSGGPGNTIDRNVISGNPINLTIQYAGATGNVARGNYIGTTSDGLQAIAGSTIGVWICYDASSNTIGGTNQPADRNIISGNGTDAGIGDSGVYVCGPNNTVVGNYIGLNATGSEAIPNHAGVVVGFWSGASGGNVIGGLGATAANRIHGNTTAGVSVRGAEASSTRILGNSILSNGAAGVELRNGWNVTPPSGVEMSGNAIDGNGGLGIDLGADGVTPNDGGDVDTGANDRLNFPVLDSAVTDGSALYVDGSVDIGIPGVTFRIEFFASATCDPSGHGEGAQYLGSSSGTTGAGGTATFINVTLPAVPVGWHITATTSAAGTSEFSACRIVVGP